MDGPWVPLDEMADLSLFSHGRRSWRTARISAQRRRQTTSTRRSPDGLETYSRRFFRPSPFPLPLTHPHPQGDSEDEGLFFPRWTGFYGYGRTASTVFQGLLTIEGDYSGEEQKSGESKFYAEIASHNARKVNNERPRQRARWRLSLPLTSVDE